MKIRQYAEYILIREQITEKGEEEGKEEGDVKEEGRERRGEGGGAEAIQKSPSNGYHL